MRHVKLIADRPSSLDVQFVDFDGVRFHLSTPERKTCLLLSMSIRCWDELVKYGVDNVLRREYGDRLQATAEPEYNVSLELDLEKFPPPGGEHTTPRPLSRAIDVVQRSAKLWRGGRMQRSNPEQEGRRNLPLLTTTKIQLHWIIFSRNCVMAITLDVNLGELVLAQVVHQHL